MRFCGCTGVLPVVWYVVDKDKVHILLKAYRESKMFSNQDVEKLVQELIKVPHHSTTQGIRMLVCPQQKVGVTLTHAKNSGCKRCRLSG